MKALKCAGGGGNPGREILEVVALQPDLLAGRAKVPRKKNKPGVGRI